MTTLQIGNKINCILRDYNTQEPLLMFESNNGRINFKDHSKNARTINTLLLQYNIFEIDSLILENIPITEELLKMLFVELSNKDYFVTSVIKTTTDEQGQIWLTRNNQIFYNMYIYSKNNTLINYISQQTEDLLTLPDNKNDEVIIYYQTKSQEGLSLLNPTNRYFTLELNTVGNINNHTATFFGHFDKLALIADKNLSFDNQLNTINSLTFNNLDADDKNYLILK